MFFPFFLPIFQSHNCCNHSDDAQKAAQKLIDYLENEKYEWIPRDDLTDEQRRELHTSMKETLSRSVEQVKEHLGSTSIQKDILISEMLIRCERAWFEMTHKKVLRTNPV